ncbi:MAG: hypothetical protein HFJ66_09505 [Eggerthellaceae bacterium]|nr:hypothetical protein [Eggerthellaceae bacterium]
MRYRDLGKTGLKVSEVGFGPGWMKKSPEQTREVAETLRQAGVNILDCWMSVLESVRAHYEALAAHAGDCIGCQLCEPRGPFGAPIAARTQETAQLFGE